MPSKINLDILFNVIYPVPSRELSYGEIMSNEKNKNKWPRWTPRPQTFEKPNFSLRKQYLKYQ